MFSGLSGNVNLFIPAGQRIVCPAEKPVPVPAAGLLPFSGMFRGGEAFFEKNAEKYDFLFAKSENPCYVTLILKF